MTTETKSYDSGGGRTDLPHPESLRSGVGINHGELEPRSLPTTFVSRDPDQARQFLEAGVEPLIKMLMLQKVVKVMLAT